MMPGDTAAIWLAWKPVNMGIARMVLPDVNALPFPCWDAAVSMAPLCMLLGQEGRGARCVIGGERSRAGRGCAHAQAYPHSGCCHRFRRHWPLADSDAACRRLGVSALSAPLPLMMSCKLQTDFLHNNSEFAVTTGLCWRVCSIGYFRFFVVLGFIFILLATAIGTLMPIWEARNLFAKVGGQGLSYA